MAHYDYLVATVATDDEVAALEPVLAGQVQGGRTVYLHGYRLTVKDGAGYGWSREGDRLMVVGTGSSADAAAGMLSLFRGKSISIARLDIQETVAVDDPDRIIQFTSPSPAYKASRWSAVGEPGETLYVGSPKSNARLRLYNKTAESGLTPGSGLAYLRIEVQLRNRYADQAYTQGERGGARTVLAAWVKRFLQAQDAQYLMKLMEYHGVAELIRLDEKEEDWIARRKVWVETSVIPALKKLILACPEYKSIVLDLIGGIDSTTGTC